MAITKQPPRNNLDFAAIKAKAEKVNNTTPTASAADTGLLDIIVDQIDVEPQIRTVLTKKALKSSQLLLKNMGRFRQSLFVAREHATP